MNTNPTLLEQCRNLISELRWNERNAEQSARIAVSKAVWLGVERDEVLRLVSTVPAASYLRQCPHILTQTWETISQANQPGQHLSEFEQLLNADLTRDFGLESMACSSIPVQMPANRKTAIARRQQRGSGTCMMFKSSPPDNPLLPEEPYDATVSSVKGLPDEQNPKRVELGFKVDGSETPVTKELSLSFDTGKPLRKDVETLLGRELTPTEALNGIEPAHLLHKPCRVVVMHKAGSGGKPKAVVSLVQPLPKAA